MLNRTKPKAPKWIKTEMELIKTRNAKTTNRNNKTDTPFNHSYWNEKKKQKKINISMSTPNVIEHKLNKSNNETNSSLNNTTNKKGLSMSSSVTNCNLTTQSKRMPRNSSMYQIKATKLIDNILKVSYRLVNSFHDKPR